jgi:hypothetical protein
MKSYSPASSRSWSNSCSINYGKGIENAKEVTDHINSLKKGERIVAAKITEIVGLMKSKKAYTLLQILSGQNMITCKRSSGNSRKWFKKHDLTETEVQEASHYIV